MSYTDKGREPAFPRAGYESTYPSNKAEPNDGMSLRCYAAIKLRVPDSGIPWLDEMIIESNRNWFAGMALQGLCAANIGLGSRTAPKQAYEIATAMLCEQERIKHANL